jgi:dTDP-4-amino-4,6-dideoxy-D-galactose acyltransferase
MDKIIKKLNWDTNFFGFKVGKVVLENYSNIDSILSENDRSSFKLVYLFSNFEIKKPDSFSNTFMSLVDIKTTFVKNIDDSILPQPLIKEYVKTELTDDLIELAIQSGVYSRFKKDVNITESKFEDLYKLWIEKLVSKNNNEIILINETNDKINGFLCLGKKNNRADLIMGAVGKNSRGLGIGKQLFLETERIAHQMGYKEIQIVTQGLNKPACELYKKLGYKIEKEEYIYHLWKND